MRFATLLILLFIPLHHAAASPARSSLSGRITDSAGSPLPGAVVELPDLHTGVAADPDGRYVIPNLPAGRFIVTIKLIGYGTQSRDLTLNGPTTLDVALLPAVMEQHEVVVTGTSAATEQRRSTTPIQSLSNRQMREQVSSNIIDAVTRVPGVQQITTGPAISKPVIRGLGYNRIITLNDGVRQEGQQWGGEHGIEIDDYNVSRVEVLKGPASLSYGSDALAGVINIISEAPAPVGQIVGNLVAGYQTNTGMGSLHGRIAGNRNGHYWSAYYTGKRAHDYRNVVDGPVFNTRFRNDNMGATIGINKHWGSSRLSFTSFNQSLGMPEGERDSATGQFVRPVDDNGVAGSAIVNGAEATNYAPAIPRQEIAHRKLSWVNTLYLHSGARVGLTLGFQQNDRKELEDVLQPDEPALHFRLRTLSYDAHYLFAQRARWRLSAGLNGMLQHNDNKGIEFLIPDYTLFDVGGYVIARKDMGRWSLAGGLRADYRRLASDALFLDSADSRVEEPVPGGHARFAEFSRSFSSPSGSIGASYAVNAKTTLKMNLASGFRAPNIAELSANGAHEGAIRYEYGRKDLRPENSFQADAGAEYHSEHLSVSGSVFYNYIHNFIHLRKLSAADGTDSIPSFDNEDGFPAFTYVQTSAGLFGGELYADLHPHPLDWLHLENTISYVQARIANGTDSTRYLPNIPGARWLLGLRAGQKRIGRFIGNAYLRVELDHYFAQHDIYSAYGTETASQAYSLVNASLGFDIMRKDRSLMSITIAGQNLGDVAYQNHLSRIRYAAPNNATGRTGIFGMGRNISLQVAVPLRFL